MKSVKQMYHLGGWSHALFHFKNSEKGPHPPLDGGGGGERVGMTYKVFQLIQMIYLDLLRLATFDLYLKNFYLGPSP